MSVMQWIDAKSVEEAVHALGKGAVIKAGGIDLLDLMKEGIVQPDRIVNLRTVAGLKETRVEEHGGLQVGALVTLAQIAADPRIQTQYAALAAAASHAATPQVRNVATLGGNVMQRPRCWYFRNEHFQGTDIAAAAREGENQYHAVLNNERTVLVHASTPATALLAYGATVHVTGSKGTRSIAIDKFFLEPDPSRDRDVAMQADEVLTQITLPTAATKVSAYHKQTERDSYDWPICDVAVVLQLNSDRSVAKAAISMGWVAPTPMRAAAAEALLAGKQVDEALAAEAARITVKAATPLSKNAYKVPVLEAVLRRTILAAVGQVG